MHIGPIDLNEKVFIVAEIGNNHEGSLDRALKMVALAAESGVDAVKFQTIVPQKLVSALQTERIRQLTRFALSRNDFETLARAAEREGLIFLSTPFDHDSARFLNDLVPAFKIASGDNKLFPLLDLVASFGKPLLLSTGLLDLNEIALLRDQIRGYWIRHGITPGRGNADMALLHCVVSYPTPPEEACLSAIRDLAALGVTPGYSDHTLGIESAVLSVGLGARVIEKHFTSDKNYSEYRDHQLSADPTEMALLVRRVRTAELMIGSGKRVQDSEKIMEGVVRRSLVAARPLEKGTMLTTDHVAWVRPGGGIPPGREEIVLGRVLLKPKLEGEMIMPEDVMEL